MLRLIFNTPAGQSAPARWFAAALAALIWLKRAKDAKKRKLKAKKTDGGAKPTGPIKLVWKDLWPRWFKPGVRGIGSAEMVGIFACQMVRVYINVKLANMVRLGDGLLYTRDWVRYRAFVRYALTVGLLRIIFETIYNQIRDRLSRKWRTKLTTMVHEEYFGSSNYYHVEAKMRDADVRITEDIKMLAEGFTSFFGAATYTATTGIFYSLKVWWEFGLLYMSAPYIYFLFASKMQPLLGRMKWSLYTELEGARAKFRTAHTRLVEHSESIAALRGERTERAILDELFGAVVRAKRKVFKALIPYEASRSLLYEHLLLTMYTTFVIGPGTFRPETVETVASLAKIRADVGYQFVLFIQMMTSVGSIVKIFDGYKRLTGNATRFVELREVLRQIAADESRAEASSIREGDSIKFEHVMVFTPTQNKLVHDLSFEVGKSDSMLLTGHNGAGKSSVFRCLAGLWSIPSGTIYKPRSLAGDAEGGGSGNLGLAGTVFYLPQKPYNVLGTLADQLTYPELSSEAAGLTREKIVAILTEVDLAYLADRPEIFTKETNWEEECSLGEKQRLAIARLIWHQPDFAILDECTSAVSSRMEERLYWILASKGITYITISHRPVLRSFHRKMLCIHGDEAKSFKFEELQSRQQLESHVKEGLARHAEEVASASVAYNEEAAERLLRERSADFHFVSQEREARKLAFAKKFKGGGSFSRFLSLLRLGKTRFSRLAVLIGTVLVRIKLTDLSMDQTNMMWTALFTRNKKLLATGIVLQLVRGFVQTAVDSFQRHTERAMQVELQHGLTSVLQDKLLQRKNFYVLKHIDGRIDDMDTRISDDLHAFCETVSDMWSQFLWPLTRVLWFARRFALTVEPKYAYMLWGYLALSTVVVRFIMPDYKQIVADMSGLEGKYKFVHSRVRVHSESIAFFGGGAREKGVVRQRFQRVIDALTHKSYTDFGFGIAKGIIIHMIPERIQDYVRFSHAYDNFSDEGLLQDNGAALSNQLHNIWATNQIMVGAVQELIDFSDKIVALTGIVTRIAEFNEVLDEHLLLSGAEADSAAAAGSDTATTAASDGMATGFDAVDLVTPAGKCLAKGLTVSVRAGSGLMVTGPNAAGKTSFFRALGGLWPSHSGRVFCPREQLFLVPQRVYSCSGSLADQVTYPKRIRQAERSAEQEAHMLSLLDLVGIAFLVEREGGWDSVRVWEDTLSLGEQQRLGMCRLFYNKPQIAVLDECTSAVSVDVEERMYRKAFEMGITAITISQRLALTEFHANELALGEVTPAGWTLRPITDAPDQRKGVDSWDDEPALQG